MVRILLVRLGALGDIIHAIPVAAAIRRLLPDAQIDWLVSAKHREILELVPLVDRCLVIDDRRQGRGGLSWMETIRELRRSRYDVAIDLQGLIKSAFLARSSGATRVIGFSADVVRERLAARFYTERHRPHLDPSPGGEEPHVIRRNLSLLEPLGMTAPAIECPLSESDSIVARQLVDVVGGPYAVINPGAAWPNKRWPPERFGAVARELRARRGLRSVVIWGPGEEALAREIASAAGDGTHVSPPTTIRDLVEVIRGGSLMVSGDTGPMHIAAALGIPIVGLFGPTSAARNGPWAADDLVLSRYASCQCHYQRRCSRPDMCLLEIDVDAVHTAVATRLEREASRG